MSATVNEAINIEATMEHKNNVQLMMLTSRTEFICMRLVSRGLISDLFHIKMLPAPPAI